MKEITRVHLAKTPYDIEVDAKKQLEKYVQAIARTMDSDEAMREIEARMVELLAGRGVASGGVITAADVAALKEQMGEPQEFSEDGQAAPEMDEESERSERRLMRDTEHALIGGVCAGIAAYFGINPLWVRIIAIISPLVSFGTAVLIYIVMWLSVPEARTASDKLQMHGKPVTFDSLKRQANQSETPIEQRKGMQSAVAKVIRFILGTSLLMAALMILFVLVVGGISSVMAMSGLEGLSAYPWAWGLWVSLVIGGIAALWLTATLSYSAFTWKLKRLSVISIIVTLIIGVLSTSSMALFGMRTSNELARDEERLTKVVPVELPSDMKDVKYVHLEGDRARLHLNNTTQGEVKAELRYVHLKDRRPQPKVTAVRDGDRLVLKVEDQQSRCRTTWFGFSPEVDIYCLGFVSIHVSGPLSASPESQVRPNVVWPRT